MGEQQSAIFIDAGFILTVGAARVTGTSLRSATKVDTAELIAGIVKAVKDDCGLDPLRIYWYDASRDGVFTEEHKDIALLNDVKVRLGRIGINGQQKGVDLRLGLDLVEVARNRAASIAYLLSGDDDLAEAVEAAQDLGMKLVLLGVRDKDRRTGVASVAEHLALRVDRIVRLSDELITTCFIPNSRLLQAKAAAEANKSADGAAAGSTSTAARSKDGAPARPGPHLAGQSASKGAPSAPSASSPASAGRSASQRGDDGSQPGTSASRGDHRPSPADIARALDRTRYDGPRETVVEAQAIHDALSAAYVPQPDLTKIFPIVEEVAAKVAESWLATSTQAEVNTLMAERPYLDPELDSTLLRDCSAQIGISNTDRQSVRQHLRKSFWDELDRIWL